MIGAGWDLEGVKFGRRLRRKLRKASRAIKRTAKRTTRVVKRVTKVANRVPGVKQARRQVTKAARGAALSVRNAARNTPGLRQAVAVASIADRVARGQRLDRAVKRGVVDATPALLRAGVTAGRSLARGQSVTRAVGGAVRGEVRRYTDEIKNAVKRAPGGPMRAMSMARPLKGATQFVRHVAPHGAGVTKAVALLERSPALARLSESAIARRLGLPETVVRQARRLAGKGMRWRGLSRAASGFVRRHATALPRMLSRYDVQGLSADARTWTVESGDTGTKIAQAVTGDPNRWRELRGVNAAIAARPDPNGWGLVAYPGDVLQLPDSWLPSGREAEAAVTVAAILKAKALLATWGQTDGRGQAGHADYGLQPADLSPDWGQRDRAMLDSYVVWDGGDLPRGGELTQAHLDDLDQWVESRAGVPVPDVSLGAPVVTPPAMGGAVVMIPETTIYGEVPSGGAPTAAPPVTSPATPPIVPVVYSPATVPAGGAVDLPPPPPRPAAKAGDAAVPVVMAIVAAAALLL